MSDDTTALTITLKAGPGYEAPWVVLRGDNPEQLTNMLRNLGELPEAVATAAAFLQATNTAAPVLPTAAPAPAVAPAPVAPTGWGQGSTSAPAPQQAQPAAAGHPEGKTCETCQAPLRFKSGTSKAGNAYSLWACPNNRTRNDGHTVSFVD